jgi:hypothetical protein
MELRSIIGIAIAVIGYGSIVFIIIYAHNREKKQRKIIFNNIRARGHKKYSPETGKWTTVKGVNNNESRR